MTHAARAIELMRQTPGFRQYTWSKEFSVDGVTVLVTEVHHGLRYQTTQSGRCPTYPVSYDVKWIGEQEQERQGAA